MSGVIQPTGVFTKPLCCQLTYIGTIKLLSSRQEFFCGSDYGC